MGIWICTAISYFHFHVATKLYKEWYSIKNYNIISLYYSNLNAIITVSLCILHLLKYINIDFHIISSIPIAYGLFDLYHIFRGKYVTHYTIILHHIILVCSLLLLDGNHERETAIGLLSEGTNVFLNTLIYYIKYSNMNQVYTLRRIKYHGLALIFSYIPLRLINFSYLVYFGYHNNERVLAIATSVLLIMNMWWFKKIVYKFRKLTQLS